MVRQQLLTMAVAFAAALAVPVWLAPSAASVTSGLADSGAMSGTATPSESSSMSGSDSGAAMD